MPLASSSRRMRSRWGWSATNRCQTCLRPRGLDGQLQRHPEELFAVPIRQPPPGLGPAVEILELDAQDCPLEGVHAIIEAEFAVVVAAALGVVAQAPEPLGDRRVVGRDRAGLAVGTEVLSRVEAEAAAQPERAGPLAVVTCPVGLGGVLDDRNAPATTDLQQRTHVGGLAVEVNRQDRPGSARDLPLHLAQVHRVGDRIDVDEDRPGPDVADGPGRRHEGHRHRDDLIPGPHSGADQSQVQRRGPRVHAHAEPGPDVIGEGLLEGGNLGPEHVGRALGDFPERLENLILQRSVLGPQVHERDGRLAESAAGSGTTGMFVAMSVMPELQEDHEVESAGRVRQRQPYSGPRRG